MPQTYEPIATTTLGSDQAGITFSSIPQTYTDLVLVGMLRSTRAGNTGDSGYVRLNGDSASNYSANYLGGDGSSAYGSRISNQPGLYTRISASNTTANTFAATIVPILNYSNTTTFKTSVSRINSIAEEVNLVTSVWRSTAAVTTIYFYANNGNLLSGSTLTLYGIKAA